MEIMDDINESDDQSMKFTQKNKNYRYRISTIVFIVYEKVVKEIIEKLNQHMKVNEKNLSLTTIEFCGYRNYDTNYYDDFHVNYLNEKMFMNYTDSIISMEKKIYYQEGLENRFPSAINFKGKALKVIKLIDNVRSPPGIYQILETANKLSKNNTQLMNDIMKFLKATDLISFDKKDKNLVNIKHSFGQTLYNFFDFIEKNKFYISPIYKNLFDKEMFGFIYKHEFKIESTNKFYKSDVYRNFLTNFITGIDFDDVNFLNCINYDEERVSSVIHQFDVFNLIGIVNLLKNLYPIKITAVRFCKKYMELYKTENRFLEELEEGSINYTSLAKDIINYHFRDKKAPEILFGRTRLFLSGKVVASLEKEIDHLSSQLEKWREYLTIKVGNYLSVIRKRVFLKKLRKRKEITKDILLRLKAKFYDYPLFKQELYWIYQLQTRKRRKDCQEKLLKAMERFSKVRRGILTFQLRWRYKRLINKIRMLQKAMKRFLFRKRFEKYIMMKKIVRELSNKAVETSSNRLFNLSLNAIANLVKKKLTLMKYEQPLKALRTYLRKQLTTEFAVIVQKNWRRYKMLKQYNRLKESTVIIQKNMLCFMWRKNYLILKRGMTKLQRIWRSKRLNLDSRRYKQFLQQSNIKDLVKEKTDELLKRLNKNVIINYKKRMEQNPQMKLTQKHPRPHNFSYVIDIDINEDLDEMGHASIIKFFNELYSTMNGKNEQLYELGLNDSHIWAISNKFEAYCWGRCQFIPGAMEKEKLYHVEFCGNKPNYMESGANYTALQYKNGNEIKFLGDFEIFGSKGKITKQNESVTTKFNNDFVIDQISANNNTFTLLSKTGKVMCWPFYNHEKKLTTRIHVSLNEKIVEVASGLDFAVFRTHYGSVYVVSNSNNSGELGNGDFKNDKRVRLVKYFNEMKEHVSQISVGLKHILALTIKNNVYGWGSNFKGQLGRKSRIIYPFPKLINIKPILKSKVTIQKITAGKYCGFALLKNQKIYFWGSNGDNKSVVNPIEYTPKHDVS